MSWTFWAASLVFGYGFAQGLDNRFAEDSPGFVTLLAIWSVCLFVSILVHELGHTLAFRQNGVDSSIVLYYLGGLAIPRSTYSARPGGGQLSSLQSMWIAAAGPLAQLLSACLLILAIRLSGYRVPFSPWPLSSIAWLKEGEEIDSVGLWAMVAMYLYPSVLWALLNLVPVWPLDGGRIMSALVEMRGGHIVTALWISVITSALLAGYGFANGETYLGMLFLILGVNNYQAIQQLTGPRY